MYLIVNIPDQVLSNEAVFKGGIPLFFSLVSHTLYSLFLHFFIVILRLSLLEWGFNLCFINSPTGNKPVIWSKN